VRAGQLVLTALLGADAPADNNPAGRHALSVAHITNAEPVRLTIQDNEGPIP
jgi:hypothetical protein